MDHKNEKKERLIKALFIMLFTFILLIIIGIVGFVYLFNTDALTALLYSTLILTGIDLETDPLTSGQKWFIIFYSIVSIIIFLSIANVTLQYMMSLL